MKTLDNEFRDYMLGYMAWPPKGDDDDRVKSFREILDMDPDERRLPVNNREPRELMSKQKYALILERDGRCCRYCYNGSAGIQIDHIVPRSAYPAEWLDIADRSDNLTVACVPCNKAKSNRMYWGTKRPGVTPACWECLNPGPDAETDPDGYEAWQEHARGNMNLLVFCGRCGMGGQVPDLSWVL